MSNLIYYPVFLSYYLWFNLAVLYTSYFSTVCSTRRYDTYYPNELRLGSQQLNNSQGNLFDTERR